MARVVFLGTPQAAVPTLDLLNESHDVGLVVTQPDRPKGRSKRPVPPPVKLLALARGLELAQPASRAELADAIEAHGPFDAGVVVAFGRILRPEVLEAPERGLLNVHFSLLPRWRGAAPVARALMAGDPMTGVTIIELDEGLDTGPVVTAQAIDIRDDENAGELTNRLATLGARLLVDSIPAYLEGDLEPVSQSNEGVTYAEKIEHGDRPIHPSSEVTAVVAQVRGLTPSPAATLEIDGDLHKIFAARVSAKSPEAGEWSTIDGVPVIGLSDGGVELVTLQPAGKKPQSGAEWVRGRHRAGGVVR